MKGRVSSLDFIPLIPYLEIMENDFWQFFSLQKILKYVLDQSKEAGYNLEESPWNIYEI